MPSLFTHGFVGFMGTRFVPKSLQSKKLTLCAIVAPILPDGDVITFMMGIPYDHVLGHRGFFHSLSWAFVTALILGILFFRKEWKDKSIFLWIILFLTVVTASHGLLDSMTTGGLGIAFWSPFENSRYFLPIRPIAVSPIGVSRFFSEWGVRVIVSEFLVVWIPLLTLWFSKIGISFLWKKYSTHV